MGKYVYSFSTEFALCTGVERLTCYAANPYEARQQVSDFFGRQQASDFADPCVCVSRWDEPDYLVSVEITPTNVVPSYA